MHSVARETNQSKYGIRPLLKAWRTLFVEIEVLATFPTISHVTFFVSNAEKIPCSRSVEPAAADEEVDNIFFLCKRFGLE